ncbi:MAG TPA: class I SAM-dependent methyltransferase [Planctomycetota bacterium]|nr:class I SAM-dependent methyltransferase [Planctomycetota bacterium]
MSHLDANTGTITLAFMHKHWSELDEEELKAVWDVHWKNEWLIRKERTLDQIQNSYAGRYVDALVQLLNPARIETVLDCTSGFGFKTMLLLARGYSVVGSDVSGVAVDAARELTRRMGFSIDFRLCAWSKCAEVWGAGCFDVIFNDALSWSTNERMFVDAARAFHTALKPGGILIWAGAAQGKDADPIQLAEQTLHSSPRISLEGPWTRDGSTIRRLIFRELNSKGDKIAILSHHTYLIIDEAGERLEVASIAEPTFWTWSKTSTLLSEAGFNSSATVEVPTRAGTRIFNISRK